MVTNSVEPCPIIVVHSNGTVFSVFIFSLFSVDSFNRLLCSIFITLCVLAAFWWQFVRITSYCSWFWSVFTVRPNQTNDDSFQPNYDCASRRILALFSKTPTILNFYLILLSRCFSHHAWNTSTQVIFQTHIVTGTSATLCIVSVSSSHCLNLNTQCKTAKMFIFCDFLRIKCGNNNKSFFYSNCLTIKLNEWALIAFSFARFSKLVCI